MLPVLVLFLKRLLRCNVVLCNSGCCPLGVSLRLPSVSLQDYLTDRDFERLLGMSRSEFNLLPKWRQNDIKKKAGLF